ncbi:MAG: hypothetical protein LKE40_05045 [Spirochaetia bacterium]|nr:hypothetical protein [Spirochaetia bacterium]
MENRAKEKKERLAIAGLLFWFARHGCYPDGESPLYVAIQEEGNRPELLARGKGVPAVVGLKEARGKVPSQRTGISYKARLPDKSAK